MYKYLDSVNSPNDIKKYGYGEMKELCAEIRDFLIREVPKTGGHLASNLGVVELTLALYKVFDAPRDKIVFDVGHQSYVSKILTGRKDAFSTLRHENGISGFPKRSESEYDAFGTGHSSTSISAALGMAKANKLSGNNDYAIAVVGDGAFSGGLVYEALNNCEDDLNLIVVLNENEMSISKNVGNIANMISKIRSKKNYFKFKHALLKFTEHIPFAGKGISRTLKKFKKAFKNALFSGNIVEKFGFRYYGPIDGNDYVTVERILTEAKKHGGSAFIHLKTQKGKGYAPAEENPCGFHMVKSEGTPKKSGSFSESFGKGLLEILEKNDKVCAVSAAMTEGTGVAPVFENYPKRCFDVGIAEAHAVTFAAGLSSCGYVPVFAVYSSFLQRAYDNLIHDVALQNLHIVLGIDRAGLSADDGATHHGIFDVAMLSQISSAEIYAPVSYISLENALQDSISGENKIYAIRYPKGEESLTGLKKAEKYVFTDTEYCENAEVTIVTYGRIFVNALMAKKQLSEKGISCNVVVIEKLTPYSESYETVVKYCKSSKKIILLEEGIKSGGFAENMLSVSSSKNELSAKISILAIDGELPTHASASTQQSFCGISAEDIVREVTKNEN